MDIENYVPGVGNHNADMLIVGEAPAQHEVIAKTPFVGPSGRELDRLLNDVGINRGDTWLTNVSKFPIPPNPKVGKKLPVTKRAQSVGIDLKQQIQDLVTEIAQVKPNVILSLGGTALWALYGSWAIKNFRGSILQSTHGFKLVPTYHPAHLLHAGGGEFKGYWNRMVMALDMRRALDESSSPKIDLPKRSLQICRSSGQLFDFINRNKAKRRLSVDIEAGGHCLPVCVGLAFSAHEGLTVPLWNEGGISNIGTQELVTIWRMLAQVLWEKDIIGQNFNYDRDKMSRLGFVIRHLCDDTMLKAFCIHPELPKNLGFNTSIWTREPFYKDEGMYEGTIEDLLIGCARDACVTYEVCDAMDTDLDELEQRDFYQNFVMKFPDFYGAIERQGMRQDTDTRDRLLQKYIAWDERLRYELFQIAGAPINVASPKQIQSFLYDNLGVPRKPTTGEEDLTALLNSSKVKAEHKRAISLILEDRRVRKTIGTYVMALPDFDGRMRTSYFPCLETGRSSTSQQSPPTRPSIEVRDENNKKKNKDIGSSFQVFSKHGDIGNDVRLMYVPDSEDEVFVQADSSQAEARVVALLANDDEMLRMYDEHDIHALTASWFFGGTESDYSKKALGYESPVRFVGKTLRHAGHLGASKRRAAISVNTDARKYKIDISITEAFAGQSLATFHENCPGIRREFHRGVIEALDRDRRRLIAPLPYGVEAKRGGIRTFFADPKFQDALYREAFSYIPQRAISDNTKAAGMRIMDRIPGIKIALEAHDGLLFCIRVDRLADYCPIIQEEMERPIDFSECSLPRRSLGIPCEIEIGPNYMELEKFQLKAAA